MILVTVGTHSQGFERLVRAADELARDIEEQVIIQYGVSQYIPAHAGGARWFTYEQIMELTDKARVVIGHAGSGTVITTLLKNKPLILAPRLSKFSEHIDDHQLELANVLQASGRASVLLEVTKDTLLAAISVNKTQEPYRVDHFALVGAIRQLLTNWENQSSQRAFQRGRGHARRDH